MINSEPIWMTPQAQRRLQAELAELAELRARPTFHSADDSTNDDGDNRSANHTARQTRIRDIQHMLSNAVVGEDPPDDGIAEPGMVVTVRYDDTGETETFLLGVRGVEDGDIDVYSTQSPLGSAITGARLGEKRSYSIPSGASVPVTLLNAVPYGIRAAEQPMKRDLLPSRNATAAAS